MEAISNAAVMLSSFVVNSKQQGNYSDDAKGTQVGWDAVNFVLWFNSVLFVMSVVMFASRMVQRALLKPVTMAARGVFEARSSSRMRSKYSWIVVPDP